MSEQPENVRTETIDFLVAGIPDRDRREIAIWVAGMCRALGSAPVRAAIAEAQQQSASGGSLYDLAGIVEMTARARAFRPGDQRTPTDPTDTNPNEASL